MFPMPPFLYPAEIYSPLQIIANGPLRLQLHSITQFDVDWTCIHSLISEPSRLGSILDFNFKHLVMKIRNKIKFISLAILISLASCKKEKELNLVNPNNPRKNH